MIRAFELPVHHIDPKTGWDLVKECWREATSFANWCVFELAKRDATRVPGMEQLPRMVPVDLYALAFGRAKAKRGRKDPDKVLPAMEPGYAGHAFFAGAKQSATCIIQAVQGDYGDNRKAVLWTRSRRLNTYTYPYPWPVHAQAWKSAWLDGSAHPHVTLTLPGGPVTLRLRGGPEFGRQMGHFRQVVEGGLPRKQVVLRQQRVLGCPHRPTGSSGGQEWRLMVKMVAELPDPIQRVGRTLTLVTDPNAFWVAEVDGRPAWILNNDHFRRVCQWVALHEARRQRLNQDGKAETRMGQHERAWKRSFERACEKHHRRMSSWLHECAAHLVGFAVRQGVGEVVYDDACKDFMPSFPWFRLSQLLKDKLSAAGIAFLARTHDDETSSSTSTPGE